MDPATKKIAVILNSEDQAAQCVRGVRYLDGKKAAVELVNITIADAYLNFVKLMIELQTRTAQGVDFIIVDARIAAICDGIVRTQIRENNHTKVIGIVFTGDEDDKAVTTESGPLPSFPLPGLQIFPVAGEEGFFQVCMHINKTESSDRETLGKIPDIESFDLAGFLETFDSDNDDEGEK